MIVSLLMIFVFSIASAQTDDYTIPALPENINPDLVIATVGDQQITLGDFAQRVRYEHLAYYQGLVYLTDEVGAGALDMSDPNNAYTAPLADLLTFLSDDHQLAASIYDNMLIEAIYNQEAVKRGITVDECQLNELWALHLGVFEFDCENLPENFSELQEKYYQDALTYVGYDKETVDQIILSLAQYQITYETLRQETPLTEMPARRTRHIRLSTEAQARDIYDRLTAGETTFEAELSNTLDTGATGNGGALGYIQQGNTVPEFEVAAFSGTVGLIDAPVQSQFGYHVIQVNAVEPAVSARQIVVENPEDVEQIMQLLEEGATFEDLAARFSIDLATSQRGGDLGTFTREMLIPELSEPIFAQTEGGFLEPIQTELGVHIIEVIQYVPVAVVDVSHILLETEAEAEEVISLLQAGADFGELAIERSIDPSAAGNRGDTLTIFTGGQQSGLFVFEETMAEIDRLVFASDVEVGTIFEPFSASQYWLVMVLDEIGEREPSPENVELARRYYIRDWETAQYSSGNVQPTGLWRRYVPFDLLPSDYNASLSALDTPLLEAREAFLNSEQANTFANIFYQLGAFSE